MKMVILCFVELNQFDFSPKLNIVETEKIDKKGF